VNLWCRRNLLLCRTDSGPCVLCSFYRLQNTCQLCSWLWWLTVLF